MRLDSGMDGRGVSPTELIPWWKPGLSAKKKGQRIPDTAELPVPLSPASRCRQERTQG